MQSLINAGSTQSTAWLRALWVGLGAFIVVAVPFYLINKAEMGRADAIEEAILYGVLALFGGGGVGAGMGRADVHRDNRHQTLPGDVGQPPHPTP
jgi:hypothetical protein